MGTTKHYTYDDYKLWEGNLELINGIAIGIESPMIVHQSIATKIIHELINQIEDYNTCEVLGKIDYKVSDDTVLRPDIALTCNETNEYHLVKAPEIIVEIISKSTAKRDEKYKFEIYEKQKVKYYIIVYPNELSAKVFKLDGKTYDIQGTFTNETYKFENTTCDININFEKIFKRFIK